MLPYKGKSHGLPALLILIKDEGRVVDHVSFGTGVVQDVSLTNNTTSIPLQRKMLNFLPNCPLCSEVYVPFYTEACFHIQFIQHNLLTTFSLRVLYGVSMSGWALIGRVIRVICMLPYGLRKQKSMVHSLLKASSYLSLFALEFLVPREFR
ncbi:uncharacterized protein LOC124702924 [Lolium rigidum]|uniref:uncharacterized protein LOC124702924 n=1 Tax=Lolium rigidum TaxID=89674 RepID=UPI001F5C8734|nr:uncharacterized protein LOC124702924 [Lolium rigidum]